MGMLTELQGKGGCVCEPARQGKLRCPLIIRPTSEDVITGHIFGVLGVLNPRWWVADFLNTALGYSRFRRQFYRRFRIELWKNHSQYPRELLPWDEGSTQVDAVITWENPPTTVFIEVKYQAAPSATTSNSGGQSQFPGDQIIRNVRVGLWKCGWFKSRTLFEMKPREFVFVLLAPKSGKPLVEQYRDRTQLLAAIPHSHLLLELPGSPFIGELTYKQLVRTLRHQRRWFGRAERKLIDDVTGYCEFKLTANLRT